MARVSSLVLSTLGGFVMCAALLALAVPQTFGTSVELTSGSTTFTVDGMVHAWTPGSPQRRHCSASEALLSPGVTRCLTYRVHNTLSEPITVRSISMTLDPRFPALPSGCRGHRLSLPRFSGALVVPGDGVAESRGLPITLRDTSHNQDNCQDTQLHFVFTGSATRGRHSTTPTSPVLPNTGATLTRFEVVGILLGGFVLLGAGLVLMWSARERREAES